MYISEATKITLTIGQIRRLVQEAALENSEGCFTEQELLQSLIVPDGGDVDESIRNMLALALIASGFAVGNIIRADDIKANVARAETPQQIQLAINQASKKSYGEFTAAQATNILMRTIYQEGKGETSYGRKLIATVIWNRAGGDANKMPGICLKKWQFSVWNGLTSEGRTSKGFKMKIPDGVLVKGNKQDIWNEVKGLTEALLNGTFKPEGNYNMYMNKDKADKSAVDSWGTTMADQNKIGKHTFGYLPEHDGFRKASKQKQLVSKPKYVATYKVKSGDSISGIAKNLVNTKQTSYSDFMKLTNEIIRINSFKKDRKGNPIIHPGDLIKLPS